MIATSSSSSSSSSSTHVISPCDISTTNLIILVLILALLSLSLLLSSLLVVVVVGAWPELGRRPGQTSASLEVLTAILICVRSKTRPWNLKYGNIKYENGRTPREEREEN